MTPPLKTIHVIDDDESIRQLVAAMMEVEGYSVRTYSGAREFLDAPPPPGSGCIVTDLRMPGMDGLELADALRRQESSLPLIVITGFGQVPLAVEAVRLGAVDFIQKPFSKPRLLSVIKTALASAPSEETEAARIRRRWSTLSPQEREVLSGLVAGKTIKLMAQDLGLSPRQVSLLRTSVFQKMQARRYPDLVRQMMAMGEA